MYLDDLLVMGKDAADMFRKFDEIFHRFREANLRVNGAKSKFCLQKANT